MSICAGVIVAVTFHKIDDAPDTKTCTKCDHEGLKCCYCAIKKCHNFVSPFFLYMLRFLFVFICGHKNRELSGLISALALRYLVPYSVVILTSVMSGLADQILGLSDPSDSV